MVGMRRDAANDNFGDEIKDIKSTVNAQVSKVVRVTDEITSLESKYTNVSDRLERVELLIEELKARNNNDPGGPGGTPGAPAMSVKKNEDLEVLSSLAGATPAAAARKLASVAKLRRIGIGALITGAGAMLGGAKANAGFNPFSYFSGGNKSKGPDPNIDERINRSKVEDQNSQFMQFGKLPGGFEYMPGHMGRLGSPAAVAATGAQPLGSAPYSSGSIPGYSPTNFSGGGLGTPSQPYSSGGRQGGYGPASTADQSNSIGSGSSSLLGPLKEIRTQQWAEMNDPKIRAAVLARMEIEVGAQGPKAQQAWLESVANRAASRGMSLHDAVSNKDGYYPTKDNERWANLARSGSHLEKKYGDIATQVGEGSNVANFATGNASGTVGFGQGSARKQADGSMHAPGQTAAFGGERFGTEKRDLKWAESMRAGEYGKKLDQTGTGRFYMSQQPYTGEELQQLAKKSPEAVVMGDPNWGAGYEKMSADARKAGVKVHDYYEGRGGPTGDKWDPKEWERIDKERQAFNSKNGTNFSMEQWRSNGNYLGATHDKILEGNKRGIASYEIDNISGNADIDKHMAWRRQQKDLTAKFMPKNMSEEDIDAFKKNNPDWKQHVSPYAFNEAGTFKNQDEVKKAWEGQVNPAFAATAGDTHNYRTPGGRMEGVGYGKPVITNSQDAKKVISDAARGTIDIRSAVVDRAMKMEGLHEVRDREVLKKYLRGGGAAIDPAQTPWCAAFVNTALAEGGMKGTGSFVATSFMNWGELKQASDTQRGDVLVESRGLSPGQTGGHVGLATGNFKRDSQGRVTHVEMYGGNQKDAANRKWVPANQVMVRRALEKNYAPGTLDQLEKVNKSRADNQASMVPAQTEAYAEPEQFGPPKPLDPDTPGIEPGQPATNVPPDPTQGPDAAITPVDKPTPPPTNEMETTNDATNAAAVDAINAQTPEQKYEPQQPSMPSGGASTEPRGSTEGGGSGGGTRHNPETRESSPGSGGRGAAGRCFL
jgi:uncharacterized protein (TIGR02594 family)